MYASRTTQFIVGIFGLVGIAALSVLAFTLGRIPLVSKPHYTLYAMFDNVSGLKVNDAIQIAGVKVGKVASITLSQKNERARVILEMNEGIMVDEIVTTNLSYEEIGRKFGLNKTSIADIAAKHGVQRKRGTGSVAHPRHKERE